MTVVDFFIAFYFVVPCLSTVDLNYAEFEYLSNHLTPEECRRLVAAAHFKSYNEPNALGQAERAMPKDIPCLELLLHWNSEKGEGRGETHEVLEHRLRQMGKYSLADWLGKTVFHQLGEDLHEALSDGLQDLANESSVTVTKNLPMPTLQPDVENGEIQWLPFDSICLALLCVLSILILSLVFYVCCKAIYDCSKKRRRRKNRRGSQEYYEMVEDLYFSESEEEKFDLRDH